MYVTYTIPFEQNDDHTQISHEIEFRSSLKKTEENRKLYRSSQLEVFCKNGVFKNFAKFTGKHLC